MFWSWVNWSYSHLSLCEVFMGLSFLMWFRSAWSAWDVQAICIVSAVSDVIFPAVPSTLIFSAALVFDHHEEEVSSLCNTADTSPQVRRLSVLWIACFNPFICVLSRKTWLVSPPKRGQLTFPCRGWTHLSYIALIPRVSCWGYYNCRDRDRCLNRFSGLGAF